MQGDAEQQRDQSVPDCQLETFPSQLEGGPPSREEPWSWYVRRRARGALRKLRGMVRRGLALKEASPAAASALPAPNLRPGDRVRVRSAEYIRSTLDGNGSYKGCGFARGMYEYCGRELRVAKVVSRFFDEARYRMLKAKNMVILEGVLCDGSSLPDTRGCDRSCFYFWRTEWLEKVAEPNSEDDGSHPADLRARERAMRE
jgi:hypothetical protein